MEGLIDTREEVHIHTCMRALYTKLLLCKEYPYMTFFPDYSPNLYIFSNWNNEHTSYYMYRLYNEVEVSTAFIIPRVVGPRYDKAVETDTELYNLLLTCDFCPFGFVRHA